MSRPRKPKGRPVSGWLILDKPFDFGSTEAVAKIKWLLKAQKAGDESFDRDVLHRTLEMTVDQDMPDQARAKLYLASGRATLVGIVAESRGQAGQLEAGIDLLKRAIELHDGCGGKKDLEGAERLLKKHSAAA